MPGYEEDRDREECCVYMILSMLIWGYQYARGRSLSYSYSAKSTVLAAAMQLEPSIYSVHLVKLYDKGDVLFQARVRDTTRSRQPQRLASKALRRIIVNKMERDLVNP